MRVVLFALLAAAGAVLSVPIQDDSDEEEFSGASSNVIANLQEQIKGLLEHRRALDKQLDTIKIANQIELTALREELDNLRREVEKDNTGHASNNQQRNDHVTVQWLQSAVQQIRTEIQTELTASHNASDAHSQSMSTLSGELTLLRSDVDSCRADLEALRRDAELNTAQTQQYSEEVSNAREKAQGCAASCANLRVQLETAQTEWNSILKTPGQLRRLLGDENRVDAFAPEHQQQQQPKDVDRRLRRVEKHLKTALWSHAKSAGREAEHKELQERVSVLEAAGRTNVRKFFNLTRDLGAVDKVQKSAAQLKEQVAALENRLDSTVPELQKELSKMEFQLAETSSNAQVAKDNQEVQSKSLKNLMDLVSGLQDGLDENRALISVLKHGALSSSAASLLDGERSGSSGEDSSDRSVRRVVRDLGRIEKEYMHILNTLPQDCEAVTGESGQYLIAPPLAPEERQQRLENALEAQFETPLLASCDQKSGAGGWTVIQRRSEGTEEFNRDWAEYRAGFGSPGGEFWLGNAAIRRLTADNCSSLRVDVHDIYGQNWFAEYTEFSVGPEDDGYRLWVNGYQGNASDAFEYQNHMQFSTIDSDRDISNTHCAANYEGGWWFSHCQHVNLNGRYSLGLTWFDSTRNEWIAVAWSEMKVRRRAGCVAKHLQQR